MTGFPKPGVPNFDWDNDESVIVYGQPGIAVFENVRGNIAVLEECGRVVEIPRQHVKRIVEAILKAAGLPSEAVKGSHDERPRDRTAAERQRRYRERKRHDGGVTKEHNPVTDGPESPPTAE